MFKVWCFLAFFQIFTNLSFQQNLGHYSKSKIDMTDHDQKYKNRKCQIITNFQCFLMNSEITSISVLLIEKSSYWSKDSMHHKGKKRKKKVFMNLCGIDKGVLGSSHGNDSTLEREKVVLRTLVSVENRSFPKSEREKSVRWVWYERRS